MIFKSDPEIEAGLGVLGYQEVHVYPRMKDVVKMFRKMALKKPPDKPGGSTEDFQILQEAFIRIGSFLQSQQDKSDSITTEDDYEEDIAKKLFREYYINGQKFESTFLHLFDNSNDLLRMKMEREKTTAAVEKEYVKQPFTRR